MIVRCLVLLSFLMSEAVGRDSLTLIKKVMLTPQDSVLIEVINPEATHHVFVHVHENEEASLEAARQILPFYGGKLVTLIHSKDSIKSRNITFTHNNTTYEVDPNRIFTTDTCVLRKNIKVIQGKGEVTPNIIGTVQTLAQAVWSELSDVQFIIAVHNNKNEAAQLVKADWFHKKLEPASFSIVSYIKKNDESSDSNLSCSDIYINAEINDSEFFIVNQKDDFDQLVRKRYNVVLQNNQPVDDGSLSVYSTIHRKRYVNAEAKMGRTEEQIRMLHILFDDKK